MFKLDWIKGKLSSKQIRDLAGNTLKAAKLSLQILRETLDGVPVPGLKGAIGGLLVVLDTVYSVKQNAHDFAELKDYLDDLNRTLAPYRFNFPVTLEDPFNNLVKGIEHVCADINTLLNRGRWKRVIDSSDDAQSFIRHVRRISQLLDAFHTAATLALAVTVESSAQDTAEVLRNAQQDVLSKLPVVEGALYNSAEREFASRCLQNTRVSVREKIKNWILNPNAPPVFWLNGLVGTGKSTIAQTIAEFCGEKKFLAASFFFSRDKFKRCSSELFFTTLARQLATFILPLNRYLLAIIKKHQLIVGTNTHDQFMHLIVEPLKAVKQESPDQMPFPAVVVIDALDAKIYKS